MPATPPPEDMNEIARLTREGRLAEATALIQRLLGGGGAAAEQAPRPADPAPPSGRQPRVFDVEPEGTEPRRADTPRRDDAAPAGFGLLANLPRLPEALRGILDKVRGGAEGRHARPAGSGDRKSVV